MVSRIICLAIGYAFGLFQTSYFYSKAKGVDIRKMGSGNAGTTNALRSLGPKAGVITLAGDVLKCLAAILVIWLIFGKSHADIFPLLRVWTAGGVILGHDFPFYLNFKGGKGIAATGGMVLSFGDWKLTVLCLLVFFGLFFLTHLVSLGSVLLSLVIIAYVCIMASMGVYGMHAAPTIEMCVVVVILCALNIYQHRANIKRLLSGTERKTYLSKKTKQ